MNFKIDFDDISHNYIICRGNTQFFKHCAVYYHMHDWEGAWGNENGYHGSKELYYNDLGEMVDAFRITANENMINTVKLIKFKHVALFERYKYGTNRLGFKRANLNKAIDVSDNKIADVFENSFGYYINIGLYCEEHNVLFEPNHNFEFRIYYNGPFVFHDFGEKILRKCYY